VTCSSNTLAQPVGPMPPVGYTVDAANGLLKLYTTSRYGMPEEAVYELAVP
jgi:hypothetical protein